MKSLACLFAVIVAASALAFQEVPAPVEPSPEHAWLEQLTGEWLASSEMPMEPGSEPMSFELTESARMLGDYWMISESSADMGGAPYQAVLTLGWDPRQEIFVGTWIDTMQPHIWHYRGTLDEEQRALTLEAEGPDMMGDPSKSRLFRDRFEVTGPDSKLLVSSFRSDDGEWVEMSRTEYRRRPAAEK